MINNIYMLVRNHDGKLVKIEKNQYTSDKQYYIDLMKIKGYYTSQEPKNMINEIIAKLR